MKIDHEFTVQAPIDRAWAILTDVETIAPCLPGAQLTGIEQAESGEIYQGRVKVKIGPVVSEFKGTATFLEKDNAAYRGVIETKGRDTRGAGNASAVITIALSPDGEGTKVAIDTDLKISGKVAQFGASMIKEVSEKLLGQFVGCLEGKLVAPTEAAPAAVGPADATPTEATPVVQVSPEPEALDLLDLTGGSAAKRLIPAAVGTVVVVAVIIYLLSR